MTVASPVKVSIAWRTWSASQDPSRPLLPTKDLDGLTAGEAAVLEVLRGGRSMVGSKPAKADGAISVQLWLEVPAGCDRSDARVAEALRRAAETLCGLACAREPKLAATLAASIDRWSRAVSRIRSAGDSAPADLLVELLEDCKAAAVVGVDHRVRRSTGGWVDLGAALMVVAGPDRYGIRLREPGRSGKVAFPNTPFEVKTNLLVDALDAEIEQLAHSLADFEARVTYALTSTSEHDVRAFLAEAQVLLTWRSALERGARAFAAARETLCSAWRRDAFTLPDDPADRLQRIDARLAQLRNELVDIPQLLLAAGSWRQANNTETLSLAAAALVPPTLIAGVLGANVLPWSTPTDGRALVAMLILMLASAVSAVLLVRWSIIGAARSGPDRRRLAAAVAVGVAFAFGVWLLFDGTAVRTESATGGATAVGTADAHAPLHP